MANRDLKRMVFIVIAGVSLSYGVGCTRSAQLGRAGSSTAPASSNTPASTAPARTDIDTSNTQNRQPEQKSLETKSVDPQVQSEIEKNEALRRVSLLADAVLALDATRDALTALDKGDKSTAIAALERASGKLELVVSRDPKLAFAPVDVSTTIVDLYASPETVRAVVKEAKDDLSNYQVQQARHLMTDLASEADTRVAEIPLATYPAAIKAVAPLVDAGKTEEAKAALEAALNTLVVETIVVPLPGVRAQALLQQAEQLASKNNRTQDDAQKVRHYLDATRTQLQLAEVLGYGSKENYKPLYAQLDDIQKQTESGHPGGDVFARIRQSLKGFKFSS